MKTWLKNPLAILVDDQIDSRGGIVIEDDKILELVALGDEPSMMVDRIIDASEQVILPGLVNTHHHFYQTLTRAHPDAINKELFAWLKSLYPVWAGLTEEMIHVSTRLAGVELLLSGCTTAADHHYIFPETAREALDIQVDAINSVGIRATLTRGSMSLGEDEGGLPPRNTIQTEDAILADCERVISKYHCSDEGAMLQVALAPCSPFSVSRALMRDAALLARDKGVMLHTHLAENDEDIAYSLEKFDCRPGQYAEDLGWTGADVWHAHCVKLDGSEIDLFARTRTGVAHCPCSNCRLGSGIAPVRALRDAGVRTGLGVDGSASNDTGNLMAEARQCMLLQRVASGAGAMSAREALEIATLGGAEVLNRPDCGSLEIGKCADIAIWDMSGVDSAGNWDPAAILLAGPTLARDVFVNGRHVVAEGRITTLDQRALAAQQNVQVKALRERA